MYTIWFKTSLFGRGHSPVEKKTGRWKKESSTCLFSFFDISRHQWLLFITIISLGVVTLCYHFSCISWKSSIRKNFPSLTMWLSWSTMMGNLWFSYCSLLWLVSYEKSPRVFQWRTCHPGLPAALLSLQAPSAPHSVSDYHPPRLRQPNSWIQQVQHKKLINLRSTMAKNFSTWRLQLYEIVFSCVTTELSHYLSVPVILLLQI